jgi:7,8-dihydropterin-6-yl-methyl-4-(beta-D-ribofuranosyl)aminobenzene 5'-phosphate synthase
MRFITLFDNYKHNQELTSLWGFSCLVELNNGKKLLFDTGSNGRVLVKNASHIGVDLINIDYLFISHPHWDHICGIDSIIELNPNITMIVPDSLSIHLIEDLKKLVKKVIVIDKHFTPLNEVGFGIYSTGVLQPIGEQSLIIEDNKKLYIVIGCGHPGVDKIEELSLEKLNRPVEYIIGGFHLLRSTPPEIKRVINKINTKYITATHCTGDIAMGMIKILYKNRFLENGVGSIIEF